MICFLKGSKNDSGRNDFCNKQQDAKKMLKRDKPYSSLLQD